jgi:hypothetical protein
MKANFDIELSRFSTGSRISMNDTDISSLISRIDITQIAGDIPKIKLYAIQHDGYTRLNGLCEVEIVPPEVQNDLPDLPETNVPD